MYYVVISLTIIEYADWIIIRLCIKQGSKKLRNIKHIGSIWNIYYTIFWKFFKNFLHDKSRWEQINKCS